MNEVALLEQDIATIESEMKKIAAFDVITDPVECLKKVNLHHLLKCLQAELEEAKKEEATK